MPQVYVTKNFVKIGRAHSLGYTTVSAQGSSRCFAKGTLVRMADGRLKAVEDISVGDCLMGIDGISYNTVVSTHSGIDSLYIVHQARGIDYTVNSKHILTLRQTRAKQHKVAIPGYKSAEKRRIELLPFDRESFYNFEISEFMAQSKNFRCRYSGFKRNKIQLPEVPLIIDPYYLGIWLGDGTAKRWYDISNTDKEVVDWFYYYAESLGVHAYAVDNVTHRIKCSVHSNGAGFLTPESKAVRDEFYRLGLIDNKHVPEKYIYNSYENRLKLLAGLIDTDGCKTKRNTFTIVQKRRCILDAVEEICHLTGFYTNGVKERIATMKRKDGSVYMCKVYQIEINDNTFADLQRYTKLTRRKIDKQCDRDYYISSISIEYAGIGEYYGFTLDNSPYFLLRDGTVVHNSSKTYSIVQWLVKRCLDNADTSVSIVRKTFPAIRRSVFRDFVEIMQSWGLWNDKAMNKSEFVYRFHNGSWIEFFSCENEQKMRGSKRAILFVNEANELSFIEWQQLQMRTTEFSILDYNPSFSEEHWINLVNKEPKTYHFISTYKDNPFLEQKVIDEIESLQWKNKTLWQVYGLGQQAIVEGLIFPNITIVESVPREAERHRYIGIDFGYENDPTAIVEVLLWGKKLYIKQHCYRTHMLTSEIIKELKKIEWQPEIISESADPRLVDEIYNAGLDIHPVHKFGGSILAGITKMQEYEICITKDSEDVIKEFRNYTYRQDKEGKWLNVPIDAYNHAIDAVRYCILEKVLGAGASGMDASGILNLLG